ncbi:hypothetical protein [Rhizobium lentis]|uniref:hypothetical protein n=1 Tax=Rhizobium lentis TaxID=1138194 RepID=UPI001C837585|nr:hypothetical protein [Rhizobium lentis]MBX5144953.1 hypothetical protein [Rhizobium lentis]
MAATRGRPTEFPIKKLIAIDQEILDAVEAFRAVQHPAINQSEAFRHILKDWLSANGYLHLASG